MERNRPEVAAAASASPVRIGAAPLAIEDVVEVAAGRRAVALERAPEFVARIERGAAFLRKALAENATVYGVNTGYGDSCGVEVPAHLVNELPVHLVRYHGCGSGAPVDQRATLALLTAPPNSPARGLSGLRLGFVEGIEPLS